MSGLAARYLLALGASALALPIFVLGFGLPPLAGLVGAVAIFCGLALFAAVRPPGSSAPRIARRTGSTGAAAIALKDADPSLRRLRAAAAALPKNAVRDRLDRIAALADRIVAEVADDPGKVAEAQRALTYYLPRAAEIAEAYALLREAERPDLTRLRTVEDVLAKLEAAFSHFVEQTAEDDMRILDMELKLVSEAIREDLGGRDKSAAP